MAKDFLHFFSGLQILTSLFLESERNIDAILFILYQGEKKRLSRELYS